MPNRGAWGTSISPGGSVTIPAGYHSGDGKVRASDPISYSLNSGILSIYNK